MRRSDRLFQITQILADGTLHRAEDLAASLGVSPRTIYRDVERLIASHLPVSGTRGAGYRLHPAVSLPPLTLTPAELEALTLGLAVVAQAADDATRAAAASLSDKLEAATGIQAPAEGAAHYAATPFADATRNLAHMPLLRAAITARQKVRLVYTSPDGRVTARQVRPLKLAYWGHVWALTVWCETTQDHAVLRLDLMENLEALPELFVDAPGEGLTDYDVSRHPV